MNRYAFLDPGMFCWSVEDYWAKPANYWALVEDLAVLMDVLEDIDAEIVYWGSLVECLIEAFPAEFLYSGRQDLRDFSNSLLTFLSKWLTVRGNAYEGKIFPFSPDLSERNHFGVTLREEVARGMSALAANPAILKTIISHYVVLDDSYKEARFVDGTHEGAIDCIIDKNGYLSLAQYKERIYEKHSKHDPLAGYGSKLPGCLSNSDMQKLLDSAVAVCDLSCLVIFSAKAELFIIFREHRPGRYHGYPIASNELSRMGISETMTCKA